MPITDAANQFTVTWDSNNNNQAIVAGATTTALSADATYKQGVTSMPALEVTVNDLNLTSGKAPSQVSNKGFVTLSYTLENCYQPYVQAIVEVEGNGRCCDLKQFGVGLMIGMSF